ALQEVEEAEPDRLLDLVVAFYRHVSPLPEGIEERALPFQQTSESACLAERCQLRSSRFREVSVRLPSRVQVDQPRLEHSLLLGVGAEGRFGRERIAGPRAPGPFGGELVSSRACEFHAASGCPHDEK